MKKIKQTIRSGYQMAMLLFLTLVTSMSAKAQVADYVFTSSSGSFTYITGGTPLITFGNDDVNSAVTNIGFTFYLAGTAYTQFVANSNGFIQLGNTAPPTNLYTPISTTGNSGIISGFGRNGTTGGTVVCQLSGTAPNRVLTVSYPNYKVAAATPDQTQNFQIKLFETTNIIQIVYGFINAANPLPAVNTCEVGIRATPTDFANRATATDWSASTAGTLNSTMAWSSAAVHPADGLTYTWMPPCPEPTAPTAVLTSSTTVNVGWVAALPTENSPAGYEYAVTTSATPPLSGTPIATNFATVTGLTINTTYYLHVRTMCDSGFYSSWVTSASFYTAGYCIPGPLSSSSFQEPGTGAIVNFDTYGGETNIHKPSSGNDAYQDFTGTTLSTYSGQDINFTVDFSLNYLHIGYGLWVDWNNNFVFDSYEFMSFAYPQSTSLLTGSFTVPAVANGSYRMRIRAGNEFNIFTEQYLPPNPCGNTFTLGQAEDYTINVTSAPTCQKPLAPMVTPIGNSAAISWTAPNIIPASGYEYTFTNSATPPPTSGSYSQTNATSVLYVGLYSDTTYYLHVRSLCGSGIFSTWASSAPFTTFCANPKALNAVATSPSTAIISWTGSDSIPSNFYEYAITTSATPPVSGTSVVGPSPNFSISGVTPYTTNYLHVRRNCLDGNFSDWVTKSFSTNYCTVSNGTTSIQMNNFNITGGASSFEQTIFFGNFSYANYSSVDAYRASGYHGQTINFSASFQGSYALSMWIDWNNNLQLEPTELVYTSPILSASCSGSFIVPAAVATGNHRLRIRVTNVLNPSPCGNYSNSLTNDYLFKVNPYIPCSGAPAAATISLYNQPCANDRAELHASGNFTIVGNSSEWLVSTVSGGPYTNFTGANSSSSDSLLSKYSDSLTAGTYYFILKTTCANSGLSTYSNELAVVVPPQPFVTITNNSGSSACSGTDVVLSATADVPGCTFYWWGPPNFVSEEGQSFTIAGLPANSGIYECEAVAPSGCFSINVASTTVVINKSPVITSVSATADTVCAGDSTTLSVNDSPTPTYCVGGGANYASLTNLQFGYKNAAGDIIPTTTVTAGSTVTLRFTTATLAGEGAGPGAWIDWNQDGIFNNNWGTTGSEALFPTSGNIFDPTLNPYIAEKDIYIPLTTLNGTTKVRVMVARSHMPSGPCTGFWHGSKIDFDIHVIGGVNANTYTWLIDSTVVATTPTITVAPTATTTFKVISTNSVGCTDTATKTIVVNQIAVNLGNDTSYCAGTVFSTTLNAQNSGATYLWSDGSITQTLAVDNAGTYSVTVTNTSGCVKADTIVIVESALPNITAQPTNTMLCEESPLSMTISSDATNFQWIKEGAVLLGETNSNFAVSNTTLNDSGSYQVALSNTAGCVDTSDVATVTVNALPSISTQPTSQTLCEGSALNMSIATNATSVQWLKGGGAISGANSATYTVSNAAMTDAGSYIVALGNATGCVDTSDAATVVVNATPNISVLGTDNTSCSSPDGSLTITSSPALTSGDSYDVSHDGGGWLAVVVNGAGELVISGLNAGSYNNVSITNLATSCVSNTVSAAVVGGTVATDAITPVTSNDSHSQPSGVIDYRNTSCELIATIDATNGDLGTVTTDVTVMGAYGTFNSEFYFGRTFDFTATNNVGGNVTLYFSDAEVADYNAGVGISNLDFPQVLPDGSNIVVTAFHSAPGSGNGPLNYDTATAELITPTVTHNPLGYYEVSFSVSGFSGFFANTKNTAPLPITMGDIKATNIGAANRVDWNTKKEEAGDRFVIERSADARNFRAIGNMDAKGISSSRYSFIDAEPFMGINYYRLLVLNNNGSQYYTKVVNATVKGQGLQLEAFPNPVREVLTVRVNGKVTGNGEVSLLDASGRTLAKASIEANGTATFNMQHLAQGMYLVKFTDDATTQTLKVTKD